MSDCRPSCHRKAWIVQKRPHQGNSGTSSGDRQWQGKLPFQRPASLVFDNSSTRGLSLGLTLLYCLARRSEIPASVSLPCTNYPSTRSIALRRLSTSFSADDRFTLQNSARSRTYSDSGWCAVLSGAVVGWRQLRHKMLYAQEQQASQRETLMLDHFVKGIQHLGDDNVDVRLGGVYSLGLLAEESAVHRQAIGDVLSSFVRNHSPWPPDRCTQGQRKTQKAAHWLSFG